MPTNTSEVLQITNHSYRHPIKIGINETNKGGQKIYTEKVVPKILKMEYEDIGANKMDTIHQVMNKIFDKEPLIMVKQKLCCFKCKILDPVFKKTKKHRNYVRKKINEMRAFKLSPPHALKKELKRLNQTLRTIVEKERNENWLKFGNDIDKNFYNNESKDYWKKLKCLVKYSKKVYKSDFIKLVNQDIVCDLEEVLSDFEDKFKIQNNEDRIIDQTETINLSFSKNKIMKAINSLNPNKASGPDGIPAKLIIWNINLFTEIFQRHLNNSLNEKNFGFSTVRLVLLPKKINDDGTIDSNNFRPICIANQFTKVLERCIWNRFKWDIDKSLSHKQLGFRLGLGTNVAIDRILDSLKKGGKHMLLLDLKGAFDNIDRSILFKKLEKERIFDQNTINTLKRFYAHNKCSIKKGGKVINLLKGVIQGSVISPGLFNDFLKKFAEEMENFWNQSGKKGSDQLFADDIVAITIWLGDLIIAADRMSVNMEKEKMKINQQKSKFLSKKPKPKIISEKIVDIPFDLGDNLFGFYRRIIINMNKSNMQDYAKITVLKGVILARICYCIECLNLQEEDMKKIISEYLKMIKNLFKIRKKL